MNQKVVENISGRGLLVLDGNRTLTASYRLTVYQKYIRADTYGGTSFTPAGYKIDGSITIESGAEHLVRCGQETNVLALEVGRQIDLNLPELLQNSTTFSVSVHDEMSFFDTPRYRDLEQE